jgi:hypothetical protein
LGVVGLLLATIGVWGVTSYAVSRRTREIGIRMALGANRQNVLCLIVRQGAGLAVVGIATGVALASVSSRLLTNLLFGVTPLDPATFAGACALFMAITPIAATSRRGGRRGWTRSRLCGTTERSARSARSVLRFLRKCGVARRRHLAPWLDTPHFPA